MSTRRCGIRDTLGLYLGCMGRMEKKMETTIMGYLGV